MADAVKELVIRIKREVDPAGAAASKAAHAAERKQISETLAAARAARKAEAEATKAAAKQAADEAKAAAAAIKQAEKEKAAAAKQTAKEGADAAKAAATAIKAAEKEIAATAKQSAKETAEAHKQQAADSKAAAKEILAAAKTRINETKQLERELFAEGRRLAKEAAEAEKKEASDSVKSSKAAFDAKTQLMEKAASQQRALAGGALAIVSGLEEAWHKSNQLALDAVDKVVDYRKALIELATLRPGGTPGQTGPELRKNLEVAKETGLPLEGVAKLTTAAYAGASSFLDQDGGPKGLMSPEDFDKSVATAGRFGAVMGGDAGAYGQAAAMIPILAGKRIDAGQFESELLRYDKISTSAGVANPALLFNAMQSNVGYASSGVLSGAELGALTAGYSQTGGVGKSSERVQQAISAVSAGLVKDRGGNIADEFADQAGTTADYFKALGITQKTGTMDRLQMIAADINAKRAKDKDFNANEYLALNGFGNEGSRASLMEFAGNTGRYGRSIAPLIGKEFQAGTVDSRFNEAVRTDSAIRQGVVDANTQLADVAAGDPLVRQNQARRMVYDQMRARGEARGSFEEYINPAPASLFTPSTWGTAIGNKLTGVGPMTLDEQVGKAYVGAAKDLGLNDAAAEFQLQGMAPRSPLANRTPAERAAPYDQLANAIQGAGGDPFAKLNEASNLMLKAAQASIDANKLKVPPAIPGKPPAGPGRL